jgi:hypothetical protein
MSDVRNILFPNFPRTVGNPRAFSISNREELNNFSLINSGENDKCFCSTCSYINNIPIFEDNFLEIDTINPEPIRKVIIWYEERNIPYVILFSGRAGFHLHGLFKSENINVKTLKNFTRMLLEETNTSDDFDPHVTGDLRRLCRIPNTQRIGGCWCVPLTRDELFILNTPEEFKKLCVAPRFLDYREQERPSILNFIIEDTTKDVPTQIIDVASPKEIFILKQILRPCVYNSIRTPNPKHDFRVTFVIEALNHGISITQIYNIILSLNWIDIDIEKTKYQIEKIDEKRKEGKLKIPLSKKRLGCEKKISCFKCILEN